MAQSGFQLFLNRRRALLVVTWVGELMPPDSGIIQKCIDDIKASIPDYVVLNLHGFTGYDAVQAGQIVKFLDTIRSKKAVLLVAGLNKDLRERMASKGLVKESEFAHTLQDALQLLLALGLK